MDHCENIGKTLLHFHLNVDVSYAINNELEELILDGIKISVDSLNIICEHFDLKILKLQNIPVEFTQLTKQDILNNIKLLSNLKFFFFTEKLQNDNDDDSLVLSTKEKYRLKPLGYNDFNELAHYCPNLIKIFWNHKKFIDKFKIPSKFIQVFNDDKIWNYY